MQPLNLYTEYHSKYVRAILKGLEDISSISFDKIIYAKITQLLPFYQAKHRSELSNTLSHLCDQSS
jgi:hypothetical protein